MLLIFGHLFFTLLLMNRVCFLGHHLPGYNFLAIGAPMQIAGGWQNSKMVTEKEPHPELLNHVNMIQRVQGSASRPEVSFELVDILEQRFQFRKRVVHTPSHTIFQIACKMLRFFSLLALLAYRSMRLIL